MRSTLLILVLTVLTILPPDAHAKGVPLQGDLLQLALRYEHGRGVTRDYRKAFRLYCMALDRGEYAAYYRLGWMYFNQRGVKRDPARAAWWFSQAAQQGDAHAQKMLALLADTEPVPDRDCRQLSGQSPSRSEIEAWVRRWAPAYGLEPALVLAVISAESGFNPRARSHKDARGLMQLIPATANRFGVQKIWDPAENMHGGMAYLKWLLRRFGGEVKLVLAAYNAGEGAVDNYQGIPPYRETRNYVERISRQYPKRLHPFKESPLPDHNSS